MSWEPELWKAMPPRLKCQAIDCNDPRLVGLLLEAGCAALAQPESWHRLVVRSHHYFATPDGHLPNAPGWYLIVAEGGDVLYVGEAEDLDRRLNSNNGSLDNFANSTRSADPTRNFLKALVTGGVLSSLLVGVVTEAWMIGRLELGGPLCRLDHCNVEKVFSVFRERLGRARRCGLTGTAPDTAPAGAAAELGSGGAGRRG